MKYIGRVALVSGFLFFAQSAQAEVIIGPRVSYYFDNSNLRTSDLTNENGLIASFDISPEVEQFLAQTPDASLDVEDRASSIGDQIAYPMIVLLVAGVVRHRQRLGEWGRDPDWSFRD